MNLTSIHLADLITLLHEVLSEQPETSCGRTYVVVEWRGRVFAVRPPATDIVGPFDTVYDLVTGLGKPLPDPDDDTDPTVWLWDGRRFVVDHEERSVEKLGSGGVRPLSRASIEALRGTTFMMGVNRPWEG